MYQMGTAQVVFCHTNDQSLQKTLKTSSTSSIHISKLTSSAPHEDRVQKFETAVEDV